MAYITLVVADTPDRDTARDIFKHIATTLGPYKRLKRIEFAALPKTTSGKIRRFELRRIEVERYGSGEVSPAELHSEDFEL
jgi:acetyl-CoA synthetase